MIRPTGSWVAMPTPFDKNNKIDYGAFKLLIDRQIQYGTSELFLLGSAGETTLLSLEEKKELISQTIALTKGKIPVFYNSSALTTEDSVKLAQYCEAEGADGVIFTVPPYVLVSQQAAYVHLDTCMSAIKISCGIYNNPTRLGVNVDPETIAKLSEKHEHFVADKEAVGSVSHLVQVKRLCGDRVNILCCDMPKYSIVIPVLALGGNGTANIGGNIIPEEVALFSRPWSSVEIMEQCRETFFKWYPLLEAFYKLSNPVVIKAALNILGLPGGSLRKPYLDFAGQPYDDLAKMMKDMGVIEKYGVK